MRTLVAIIVLAAFAGCADSVSPALEAPMPAGTTADPAKGQVVPAAAKEPTLAFSECLQFHTTFPGRAEDFADQVPEGYTLLADEQGLVALTVTPTSCPGANQMWISLPVAPPAELGGDGNHHLALEIYGDEGVAPWLEAAGMPVRACICHGHAWAPAVLGFQADAEGHTYRLETVLAPSDGAFDQGALMMHAATADGIRRVLFGPGASTSVGVGAVALTYEGSGGAPPAIVGHVAHVVEGLTFTMEVA